MSDRDPVEIAKRIVKDATDEFGDNAHSAMHLESSSVLWEIVNALIKERERTERLRALVWDALSSHGEPCKSFPNVIACPAVKRIASAVEALAAEREGGEK